MHTTKQGQFTNKAWRSGVQCRMATLITMPAALYYATFGRASGSILRQASFARHMARLLIALRPRSLWGTFLSKVRYGETISFRDA